MQNKDILFSLALELDLPNILNLCLVNKTASEYICRNDNFWLKKMEKEGIDYKRAIELVTAKYKDKRNERLLFDLMPNISPAVFYRYLFLDSPVETYQLADNANYLYASVHKNKDGKYSVDVLGYSNEDILSSSAGKLLDYKIRGRLYKYGKWDSILIPFYRFKNIERVIVGIPQTKIITWSPYYKDEWNYERKRPNFYGNTLLLDLGNHEYIFLRGQEIYSFKIPKGEEIFQLYSFMGTNTVPYPVAVSSTYLYDLSSDFKKIIKINKKDLLFFNFKDSDGVPDVLEYVNQNQFALDKIDKNVLLRY